MFGETIEAVEKRVEAGIGKVTVAKTLDLAAPIIAKLLRKDDSKREKAAAGGMVFSWEKPQYDTAAQQRRLRILSAIFLATARFGGRADTWGGGHDKPIEEFAVVVGHQRVLVKATVVESSPQRKPDNEPRTPTVRIRIEMDRSTFWEDGESPLSGRSGKSPSLSSPRRRRTIGRQPFASGSGKLSGRSNSWRRRAEPERRQSGRKESGLPRWSASVSRACWRRPTPFGKPGKSANT